MTGGFAAVLKGYDAVDRYLRNPRLTHAADLGTVLPFVILGFLIFIASAVIVPAQKQAKPSASTSNAVVATSTPAAGGEDRVNAEAKDDAKEPSSTAAKTSAQIPPAIAPTPKPSDWRYEAASFGLFAGWGCWLFALILCAVYEMKIVIGSIVMVFFGVIISMMIGSRLS